MTCEHCGAEEATERDLGAHGVVALCDTCNSACLHGTACPLGDDCPEEHGANLVRPLGETT